MNLLEVIHAVDKNSYEAACVENPPVLSGTQIADVIATVPNSIFEKAYQHEIDANYSVVSESATLIFKNTGTGLLYHDAKIGNFYYEIVKVAVVLGPGNAEHYMGYNMDVQIHVFCQGQRKMYALHNITKEQLESPDLLKCAPLALPDPQIAKADLKNVMYSYSNYLLTNFSGEIEYVTQHTGWINFRNQFLYVDGEKALGHPDILIRAMRGYKIKDTPNMQKLWEEFQRMRSTLREKGHMDALLLYVTNSYLFTLFEEADATIKHIMFLVGQRATRKTSVALCFSQLENKKKPSLNFLATESGIQSHFQRYHDATLVLDDFCPSTSDTRRAMSENKLEMLTRLFGDAGERVINTNFLRESAKKVDYSVHGGAIVTGEYFYSAGVESSIARTVVLEFQPNSVNLDLLTYYQENPEIFESLIFRYLVYVSNNWERCRMIVHDVVSDYRRKYQGRFSNDRYADYLGQYMAGANILSEFFLTEAWLATWEITQFLTEVEDGILKLLNVNDRKMKGRNPVNILLLAILYAVETGKVIPWGHSLPHEGVFIIEREETYHLRQNDLPDILKAYCLKTGEPYVKLTSQALGKLLQNAEVCTVYPEGSTIRLGKKYVSDYGNTRLMELSKEQLYKIVGPLPM